MVDNPDRYSWQDMLYSPRPPYAGNGTSLLGQQYAKMGRALGLDDTTGPNFSADKADTEYSTAAYNTLPWLNPMAWFTSAKDAVEGTYGSIDRSMHSGGNPDPVDAITAIGAVMGMGGLASRGGSAVSRRAANADGSFMAYRGVNNPEYLVPKTRSGRSSGAMWMSDDPDVASAYADIEHGSQSFPSVAPLNVDFKNQLTVDAGGRSWAQIPYEGKFTNADVLARLARMKGHDGLVIKNVNDHPDSSLRDAMGTTYAALQPGTVRSATTGETLFSNASRTAAIPSLAAANQEPTRRSLLDALAELYQRGEY